MQQALPPVYIVPILHVKRHCHEREAPCSSYIDNLHLKNILSTLFMQNVVAESLNLASPISDAKTNIQDECEQRSCVYKCFNAVRMWLEWLAICRT